MLIDSIEDYNLFFQEVQYNDLIIDCIGQSNRLHPAENKLSLVLIKDILTNKVYCISVDHIDFTYQVNKQVLLADFNKNLYGTRWVIDKKRMLHYLELNNLNDIKVLNYNKSGTEFELSETFHSNYYRIQKYNDELNVIIPASKHLEYFNELTNNAIKYLKDIILDWSYNFINNEMTNNLYKIEKNGLKIDINLYKEYYSNTALNKDFVYTEYNIFTSTGRPSNRFGGVNYSALKKDDNSRKAFISRFNNGKLLLIDYSAYHPHLISKLVNYHLPQNPYKYLGHYYFNKSELLLTDEEIVASKNITFKLLYGNNIPEEYLNIPYFQKINDYINHRWEFFIKNQYVQTPLFRRCITVNNIQDPTPKKLFNYIIQAAETEYNIVILGLINSYLDDKKSKAILYTYDSILFDISPDENIIEKIKELMMSNGFPVKCYIGDNYKDLSLVSF